MLGRQLHSSPALSLLSQKSQALVFVSKVLDLDLELADSSDFRVAFQAVYSGLLLEEVFV